MKHRPCESSRLSVLLAGVIGGNESRERFPSGAEAPLGRSQTIPYIDFTVTERQRGYIKTL